MSKFCQWVQFSSGFTAPDSQVLDVAGDWISLGGVDLQINGALGLAFPDLTAENSHLLAKISQFLWDVGVDGFLPTLVTTSVENIQRSLAVIADFLPNQQSRCQNFGSTFRRAIFEFPKARRTPSRVFVTSNH